MTCLIIPEIIKMELFWESGFFLGEEYVCSGSYFIIMFREVRFISVDCKYHVSCMVSDVSIRMG